MLINIFLVVLRCYFISTLRGEELRILRIEYGVMMVCSLIRVIIDSLYLFLLIVGNSVSPDGVCVNSSDPSHEYTFGYNVAGSLLMHILPIVVILKIYTYNSRRRSSLVNDEEYETTQTQ